MAVDINGVEEIGAVDEDERNLFRVIVIRVLELNPRQLPKRSSPRLFYTGL